jgi:hypothetical protein
MALVNDHTLIEVRKDRGSWLFTCCIFVTISLLTVAWGNVMDGFIRFKSPFFFTTAEYNIADIAKEIRTPNPDIAIVGSSLSKILAPGLFDKAQVMNLSVGGGSVMTGLEILSSAPALPKVILIEINILDRPVDNEWKDKGIASARSRQYAILSGTTKPFHYIFTKPYFSHLSSEQQTAWWSNRRTVLRSQDTATYDIENIVSAGRVSWSKRNSWQIADQNFKRIQDLVINLESRGAKVYLLYLPYAAGYDNHAFAQRNRVIASGNDAFNCQRCIDVRKLVNAENLRWGDGAHLDDRSALIVAEALQNRLLLDF